MLHALPGVAAASPASVGVLLDWPAAGADSVPVSPTSRAKTPHSCAAPRPTRDSEPGPFKPGRLALYRPRVPAPPPPAPPLACSFTWVPPFLGAWASSCPASVRHRYTHHGVMAIKGGTPLPWDIATVAPRKGRANRREAPRKEDQMAGTRGWDG